MFYSENAVVQAELADIRAHLKRACEELEAERNAKRALEDAFRQAKLAHRPLEDVIAEKQSRLADLERELHFFQSKSANKLQPYSAI